MACTGSSPIAIRWGLPLVLLLVSIAVSDGADKKAAAKTDKKAKKDSSSPAPAADTSGPKLPGEKGYWTQLLGLGFSEGTLTPAFSPDVLDYDLQIGSGKSKELLVTPMINTNKYELLYTPSLYFNGKLEKYSPIQNIEFKQLLNLTGPGPLDMKMTVQVLDAKTAGDFGGANEHTYTMRVVQAPDIEEILTAKDITVVGRTKDGKEVKTKDSYDSKSPKNEIRYQVGSEVQHVEVTVNCPAEATSLKYNGRSWDASSGPYISQAFEGATKSILGQCIYKDKKWTKGQEMQRTYVITIGRNSELGDTIVDLRVWPPSQAGACEQIGPGKKLDTKRGVKCNSPVQRGSGDVTNTPTGCNKYYGLIPGWKCMSAPPSAQFVGSFDNPHAELLVINKPTGSRYRLWNGIPTLVPLTEHINEDMLVLEAGTNKRNYTFLYGPPPTCETMHYATDRDASKAWAVDRYVEPGKPRSWQCGVKDGDVYEVNAKTIKKSCNWDPCLPKDDFEFCCRKVRMPCGKYDAVKNGEIKCPGKKVFSPEKGCSSWPCKSAKVEAKYCCGVPHKGGAAPCSTMQCPADSVLSEDASELSCFSKLCVEKDAKTCCEPKAICDSMKCPSGFHKKYNAALYLCAEARCGVLDRDTCCDAAAYCDEFQCPSLGVSNGRSTALGWIPKPDAANIPCGGKPCIEWDTGICCNKMGFCASFECPVGFYMKEGAEQIPCEGGGMHNCTQEDDLMKCCQPAAKCLESNVCTDGYHFKLDSVNRLCRSAECQLSDRDLCCDMVNPFKAAASTRVIPGKGEGECKMLDGPTYFECKATGHVLNLEVEYTFDKPVGNKVYMGETMISGKVGSVKIPQIETPPRKKTFHMNVDSLVAGHGAVEHRIQITVVPPTNLGAIAKPHEKKKAAPAPASPAPASKSSSKAPAASSKGSSSGKDKGESKASSKSSSTSDTASKEASSASDKTSKGASSSSDKSSKDSSSSSGESKSSSSKSSKDASSESATVARALRKLRQRDVTEAGTSVASSDSADTWLV